MHFFRSFSISSSELFAARFVALETRLLVYIVLFSLHLSELLVSICTSLDGTLDFFVQRSIFMVGGFLLCIRHGFGKIVIGCMVFYYAFGMGLVEIAIGCVS